MNEYKRVVFCTGKKDIRAVSRALTEQPPDVAVLRDNVSGVDVLLPSADKKTYRQMELFAKSGLETGVLYAARPETCRSLFQTVKLLIEKKQIPLSRLTPWYEKSRPLSFFEHKALVEQLAPVRQEYGIPVDGSNYPASFLRTFIADEKIIETLRRPVSHKGDVVIFDGAGNVIPEKPGIPDDLSINDSIILREGIPGKFMDLMINLYKPFLATSYKKARYQYTIRSKKNYTHPLGFIAVDQTTATGHFIEIALIPDLKERYYSFLALLKLFTVLPLEKYGWTIDKANYPSLRLLEKLGGGFYEVTVKNKKRIQAEGFFRVDRPVSSVMQEALRQLKPVAKEKYHEWLKLFHTRVKEKQLLMDYLEACRS